MTKQELLNSIISITKKTGQGVSGIIKLQPGVSSLLEELIDEGKIIENVKKFNYLPDDCWYLPVGCYNVWNEYDIKQSLIFIRIFLGIDELVLEQI